MLIAKLFATAALAVAGYTIAATVVLSGLTLGALWFVDLL